MSDYSSIVARMKRNELQSSLYVGGQENPDTEAKFQALAERVGMPVETVKASPAGVELHDKLQSFDYEKVIRDSPKLSAWLTDPKNMAIAQDDINQLSALERTLIHGKDYSGAFGKGVVGQGAGTVVHGAGELYGAASRTLSRNLKKILPEAVGNLLDTPVPWWASPESILKKPGKALKDFGEYLGPPKERESLGTDVAGGIGQLGFQIGAYLLTGGASSSTMMFSQGVDVMAEKTAKDKTDPALRDSAMLMGGSVTMLTERYGLDKILNRVPPEIKNRVMRFIADKFVAGGIEAAQEFTEGLLHDITRMVMTNPDAPMLEGVTREMSAAAISAAVVRTALGVRGFRQAQQNEQFFTALGEGSTDSKLRERMPERYQALVEQYTKDGPVQSVMVPAQQFAEYFQSQKIDPAVMAAEIGASNFNEALAAGGDVVIPMANFVTTIAPSDHLQGLMPDLRLGADQMTMREAELAKANMDENERELREEAAKIDAAAKSDQSVDVAIQRVITDVEGQLLTRYDPKTARELATVMRGAAVVATRAYPNLPPLEAAERMWEKYGLNIRANPLPDVLTKARDFDALLDPVLDRIRKGEAATEREKFGPSLSDFLRSKGGVQDMSGELSARDAEAWDKDRRKPGERKLVNPGGLTFDAARELAAEAGYDVGDGEASLIDALDAEFRGNPVYAAGGENQIALDLASASDSIAKALSELGIDLKVVDNAGAKKALTAALDQSGERYEQSIRQSAVAEAKRLGLPATGTTAEIRRLIDIVHRHPAKWTKEEFALVAPLLSIHQDVREGSDKRAESIMRDGLNSGMVDDVGNMALSRGWTWARGLQGGNAYIFLTTNLKFRGDSPSLQPGNMPIFRISPKKGQDFFPALQTAEVNPNHPVYEGEDIQGAPSAALLKWFGDSKIVDESGNPLVTYKAMRGDTPHMMPSTGMTHVATARLIAEEFAYGAERKVQEVYVKAEKPFDFREPDDLFWLLEEMRKPENVEEFNQQTVAAIGPEYTHVADANEIEAGLVAGDYAAYEIPLVRELIEARGYDAIYMLESGQNPNMPNLAVFKDTQLKSVKNRGTYSEDSGNIFHQEERRKAPRVRLTDLKKPLDAMTQAELIDAILRLRNNANENPLTGLPSKTLWTAKAVDGDIKRFVASIDADGLKWFNDEFKDHSIGDMLLRTIGDSLRRAGVDAYHVSGDEFYATADTQEDLDVALKAAQNDLRAVTFNLPGWTVEGAGFSYGIAENTGTNDETGVEAAIKEAENGLAKQKADREANGERAGRGDPPPGAVRSGDGTIVGSNEGGDQTADGAGGQEFFQDGSIKPAPGKTRSTKPGDYENLPKNLRKIVDAQIDKTDHPEIVRQKLIDLKDTSWARAAIDGAFARHAIDELIAGRVPKIESVFGAPSMQKDAKQILEGGEEAVWDLLSQRSFIGHAGKPVNSVPSSYLNCEPTRGCATYCYATNGNQYPQIVSKAELTAWAIERDPVRAAKIVARQYKGMPEFEASKTLRMFDRGDGSNAWLPFLDALRAEGVRTHIFTKRPEFLRQVDPFHLRLLSIDSENMGMSDQNPDLPVAFVFSGAQSEIDWIKAHPERIQVILPIVYGDKFVPPALLNQLPKETKPKICPVDSGSVALKPTYNVVNDAKQILKQFVEGKYRGAELKAKAEEFAAKVGGKVKQVIQDHWTCLHCDKGGGVGCQHGQTTESVIKKLVIPIKLVTDADMKVKELQNVIATLPAEHKQRLLAELDALLANARQGFDARAEAFYDPEDARRAGRAAKSDREDGGTRAGGGEEVGGAVGGQQVEQPRRVYDEKTIDIFGSTPGGVGDTRPDKPGVRGDVQSAETLPRGTFATRTELTQESERTLGAVKVKTKEDAAQAMAYLGQGAVERFDALITDKNGKPLAIVGAFKGALDRASVYPATLVGEAFRVPGAAHIWFAHNHPSGTSDLSDADRRLTSTLLGAFNGSKIKPMGMFAITSNKEDGSKHWSHTLMGGPAYGDTKGKVTKSDVAKKVPVLERTYVATGKMGPQIISPKDITPVADKHSGGESGLLLLDFHRFPIAFVPIDPQNTKPLREDGRMDALYKALSIANAGSAVVIMQQGAYTDIQIRNVTGLLGSLDISTFDVLNIKKDGTVDSFALRFVDFKGMGFSQKGADDKLGSIQISPDRKININLFEKANLSTFIHEAGHFYLEVLGDLAEDPDASQEVKDDYARILKYLGVASRAEITTAHHEKWARANEAYMMEGKAPAPELRGTFQRFRSWMTLIYKHLTNLDVKLNDEVRAVFDRIYATDQEIARAEAEAKFDALFIDAAAAGMTEQEFALYREAVVRKTADAKEVLQQKLLRIELLKREAWWADEIAKKEAEVAEEYDALPAAQALARMAAKGSTERLNRAQLIARYGDVATKSLPRLAGSAVYAADGQDIDSMAEVMGFANADDMVTALKNLPDRKRFIKAEAEQRLREQSGDLLNSVALADEAMGALHNDQREAVLKIELRALHRKMAEVKPFVGAEKKKVADGMRMALAATGPGAAEAARNVARGMVGQKQIRDLTPNAHMVAARKANKEAIKALAKGDYVEAAIQKQRELLNHYLYIESSKAKAESERIVKYLRGFDETKKRQKLGLAGADYLAQVDAILERYELKNVGLRAMARRESLSAWLDEQEAQGNTVSVPQEIQDESRMVNWRQIPMDELRAVEDAVRNIAHLANLKNKLIRKGKAVEFGKVVTELMEAISLSGLESTGDLARANDKTMTLPQKGAKAWRGFDAAHIKVEQLVEWLDGGAIDGPWARYFFDLADHAQTTEYDLHAMVTTKVEALSKAMPKAWRTAMLDSTTVRLPGLDGPISRFTLISIAMNMGNAQNIQRLKDGRKWTDAHLSEVRAALTKADMDFVQGTWDAIEELWPHMAELEKRTSGLEPVKVAPVSFEAFGQTYRGGYFPLVYDKRFSQAGERQTNEAESVQSFMSQGYGRATTNRGATKTRLEKFSAPVMLDYEHVVTSHLAKVIKDISHREAVLGINKILTQKDIKAALIDKIGIDRYEQTRKWLQTLVSERSDTLAAATGGGKWLMKARTNTAIVTMGWKISTMMAQFAGITPILDLVKPQFLAKAMLQTARSPVETWAMVQSKSGEMRNRANSIERDVRDALMRMRGENSLAADVRRTAFFLTAYADRAVSVPAWVGAYQQALAEGKAEEDAVRAGDRAVRLSQGAGGSKDLAAVQRSNELMRLLTMYYTPFSVLYSRLRDVGHHAAADGIGYLPKAVARLTALVMIPAVMGDLLAGRGPSEEEDDIWWGIRKMLLYPISTLPVIRDLAGYLEAGLIAATDEGEMKFPPSYKLSPVVTAVEKLAKLPGKWWKAATGDRELDTTLWDTLEASGYAVGLPTAQVRITGEYLEDLLSGDADPDNAAELMRDALFRRQQK